MMVTSWMVGKFVLPLWPEEVGGHSGVVPARKPLADQTLQIPTLNTECQVGRFHFLFFGMT